MQPIAIPHASRDVQEKMLRFGAGGPSVEEAKAAMLAAKEPATTVGRGTKVPNFIQKQSTAPSASAPVQAAPARDAVAETEAFLNEQDPAVVEEIKKGAIRVAAERAPAEALQTAPAPPPEAPSAEPQVRTIRNNRKGFTGKVYKENKLWVAVLEYDNGAGTEKFTANTKDDLMMQLLEGKGNGTVRVRQAVRRERMGYAPDTQSDYFNQMLKAQGVTKEEYSKLPSSVRQNIDYNFQTAQAIQFANENPDVKQHGPQIADALNQYLEKQGWAATARNFLLAYRDLLAEGAFTKNETVAPEVSAAASTPNAPPRVTSQKNAPPAPVAPITVPQKRIGRISTGIIPGMGSGSPDREPRKAQGEQEISEQELRKMPMSQLKKLATANRQYR